MPVCPGCQASVPYASLSVHQRNCVALQSNRDDAGERLGRSMERLERRIEVLERHLARSLERRVEDRDPGAPPREQPPE